MADYVFDFEGLLDKNLYTDGLIFSETPQLCAHNSFASLSKGFDEHPMQYLGVDQQFYAGTRCFMIDVYEQNGELVLLHNKNFNFLEGVGKGKSFQGTHYKFEEFLTTIGTLLKSNTKSVISLIIENESTVTHQKIKDLLGKLDLYKYALDIDPNDKTLSFGKIRAADKRLLVYAERGSKDPTINIFSTQFYKETTYSLGDDKDCIDRKEGRVDFKNMYINVLVLNHFYKFSCDHPSKTFLASTLSKFPYYMSDYYSCNEVNAYKEIESRVDKCKLLHGFSSNPTYIAVDFVEEGKDGGALKLVSDLIDKSFYPRLTKSNTATSNSFSISISSTIFNTLIFVTGGIIGVANFWIYLKHNVFIHYRIGLRTGHNEPWLFNLPRQR